MEDVVNLKKISCDMMSGLEKSEEELSNIKNLQLKFCYEKEKDGKRWNGEISQTKLSDVEESSVNLCNEQENEKQVELDDGNESKLKSSNGNGSKLKSSNGNGSKLFQFQLLFTYRSLYNGI